MTNDQKNTGTFSLFADFRKNTPAVRDASCAEVFEQVTGGTLAAQTQQLRSETDAATVDKLKKALPFLTVSARFGEAATDKNASQPITHSGHLCFDFDHLQPDVLQRIRTGFQKDRYTVLQFVSPRGEGLKRVVKVNGVTVENHKAVYYCLVLHHYHNYRAVADETCVNLNRGTFLPHDSDAHYNANATAYEATALLKLYPDAEKKAKLLAKANKAGDLSVVPRNMQSWSLVDISLPAEKKPQVSAFSLNGSNTGLVAGELIQQAQYTSEDNFKALDRIVAECEARNISLSGCHDNNIKIGWALHSIGAGPEYFHRITRLNPDYDFNKMEARFAALESNHDAERCGFGALVNLAKEAGISAAPKRERLTVSNGHNNKVTQMDVRDAVKQLYHIYLDAGTDAYYYGQPGDLNPFNFTPFTAKSTFLNELLGELEGEQLFISKGKLEETLFNKQTYTVIDYLPLQLDWLQANYDGQDHISALLATITTEDDTLFAAQFRKWLVNLVAQCYGHDGSTRNDNAFVLVSEQGTGKTRFFENLLWSDRYFAAKPDFNFENKEHLLLMSSKVLVLLDEMGQYNKADIKVLKAAFSQTKITADRKFQETRDYKRNASFAGCSNNTDFLKDDTGDRRFLVFQMLNFNPAAYEAVDKAQLWGQVVSLYKSSFEYHFNKEEIAAVIQRNLSQFTMHKPEDSFIESCLEVTGNAADWLGNADLEKMLNQYRVDNHVRDFMGVSSIRAKLKLAGALVGQQKKIAGKVVKGYKGVRRATGHEVTAEDIKHW
jgi:hypothetical protein